jgi:Phosphatidylinositol-4-phosphate 5-Kinase
MKEDTEFLHKHNLMDYSLLFAVERNTEKQLNKLRITNAAM